LPIKGKEKKRARELNNLASPFDFENRIRIPVHFAADCEGSDAQVLAADELRRAAAESNRAIIEASQLPGKRAKRSGAERRKAKSSKANAPDDALPSSAVLTPPPFTEAPVSAPGGASPTLAAVIAPPPTDVPAPVVAPPITLGANPPAKRSRTPKSSTRFPLTLWKRAQEQAAAAAAELRLKNPAFGKPAPTVQRLKVKQATFDALHEKDRQLFEVYTSDEEKVANIESGSEGSASGTDQVDGAFNPKPRKRKTSATEGSQAPISGYHWPKGYGSTQAAAHVQTQRENSPAISSHKVLLVVKKSTTDGSCMFDSIAKGLAHILEHDSSAFGGNSSRSALEAIQALTDPLLLRSIICDHLSGPFADISLACLHDQSPRRAVVMDYIERGYPLHDADWTPPSTNPKQVSQIISSYEDYVTAMRKKGACGDEFCLAASADLLGLRHIIF
jgi:hypothetical protein